MPSLSSMLSCRHNKLPYYMCISHSNMSPSDYGDSELAIEVSNVHKQYGRGRRAQKVLKGINMNVPYYSMLVMCII